MSSGRQCPSLYKPPARELATIRREVFSLKTKTHIVGILLEEFNYNNEKNILKIFLAKNLDKNYFSGCKKKDMKFFRNF